MYRNDQWQVLVLTSQYILATCLFSIKSVVEKQNLSLNNCLKKYQRPVRKRQGNVIQYLLPLLFHSELSDQIYPLISHSHTSAHIHLVPTALTRTHHLNFPYGKELQEWLFLLHQKEKSNMQQQIRHQKSVLFYIRLLHGFHSVISEHFHYHSIW